MNLVNSFQQRCARKNLNLTETQAAWLNWCEAQLHAEKAPSGQRLDDKLASALETALDLELDAQVIVAGLASQVALYGVPETASVHASAMDDPTLLRMANKAREFDTFQALILQEVDGQRAGGEKQNEVIRKMLLSVFDDIRSLVWNLLLLLQDLRYVSAENAPNAETYARVGLSLYAPLANRLGFGQIKWEIEDLAFKVLNSDKYKHIARLLAEKRVVREAAVHTRIAMLRDALASKGIAGEVYGRPKHIFSIWKKMQAKALSFDQLYDVCALRVLVDNVDDCYRVLDVVHNLWPYMASEYTDYIVRPKSNGYQSLHTVVATTQTINQPMEVQIRTKAMHEQAEMGMAAHWRYKENSRASSYDQKIALLRQLFLKEGEDASDRNNWLESSRVAALDEHIYVISPQGRIVELPRGATALDFAYAIHTQIGHRCRGALVDNKMVPLHRPLETGQTVEVLTGSKPSPARDWLRDGDTPMLISRQARSKIRNWFNQQDKIRLLEEGKRQAQRFISRGWLPNKIPPAEVASRLALSLDAFYMALAQNKISRSKLGVAMALPGASPPKSDARKTATVARTDNNLAVEMMGVTNLLIRVAQCCKPQPPMDISGYLTAAGGATIHRSDCLHLAASVAHKPERLCACQWQTQAVASADKS